MTKMMNLKTGVAAVVFALAAGSASAVTILDRTDAGLTFDVLASGYNFQETFVGGTPGTTWDFTFENTNATSAVVTISSASIIQTSTSYFTGGASVSWSSAGTVASAAQSTSDAGNLTFVLAGGASDTLSVTFGTVVTGATLPDIDFTVEASLAPIPVPAAGFLLLGGLGGLAALKRRKKA